MQVTETEIILPFSVKRGIPLSRRDLLSLCLIGFALLGVGLFWLIPHGGPIPTAGGDSLAFVCIVLAILFLLPSVTALVLFQRGERSPQGVHITHEGILFAHLFPTVVAWSEISALVPYRWTYMGRPLTVLGVVPHDPEAIIARYIEKRSRNVFIRFLAKSNIAISRRANTLTPLHIPQAMVPITIDELLAMIQERFADELREHHIAVLGWDQG